MTILELYVLKQEHYLWLLCEDMWLCFHDLVSSRMWHYNVQLVFNNSFSLVIFIWNFGNWLGEKLCEGKICNVFLFSFIIHPFCTPQMINKLSWTESVLEYQVHAGVRAKNPGCEWLLKDPLLWAVGWLFPWQVDAIFLGEDHFMLLSMFNLCSKAFPSKWQSPTVLSKRLVNQKPYEIHGISMPPPLAVPPGKESPVPFRF